MSTACAVRSRAPEPGRWRTEVGTAPEGFRQPIACGNWEDAVQGDGETLSHVTFPELDPRGCYVQVTHPQDGGLPTASTSPAGCGYPSDRDATMQVLQRYAEKYEAIAAGEVPSDQLPIALACDLPERARRATARVNAATLRATARRLSHGRTYAYGAASTFGFGYRNMEPSALTQWLPDEACPTLDKSEMDLFSINRVRAYRAASVQLAGIAPVVTVSGGAVHSSLTEAFMLTYLASCRFGVPRDAMLLDPCADHTHTNFRNTASLVLSLDADFAYVVTDDGPQAEYLEDWTIWALVGGTIDQRALRDWGYLLGSWRRASVGLSGGYWYTPYRFWRDPDPALSKFTCVSGGL